MEAFPSLAMVAVECSNVVISILFKAASLKGLSYYIFTAYCYVLATLVFIPLFFFRNTVFPAWNFPLISLLCLHGITGFIGSICQNKGIELGSPILASAISNLTPAFTFILAVSFRFLIPSSLVYSIHIGEINQLVFEHCHTTRMERVELRRAATQAKIIGTITSISGAFVMIFYKGPMVIPSAAWTPLSSSSDVQLQRPLESSQSNWITGGILEAIAYLLYSYSYIILVTIS
ncbi:hypothetical protein V6N11_015537 [Hibiscus sabdariffa]|uniref:WAT1-related protein n=1 Tax=Hibiscus sabdariffa TaxID=183260 RepID=A0ABR2TT62_9ROSI